MISCMKAQQLEIDDFMFDCYKRACYEAYNAPVIYPMNEENLWEKKYFDLQPPPIKR